MLDLWGLVPGSAASSWEMGRRVGEWILGHLADASPQARTSIAFDYSVDYELLEYAIRDAGLWDRVREVIRPRNVNSLTGTVSGKEAAEEAYRSVAGRGLRRHHALADALALRAAFLRQDIRTQGTAT